MIGLFTQKKITKKKFVMRGRKIHVACFVNWICKNFLKMESKNHVVMKLLLIHVEELHEMRNRIKIKG